MRKKVSERAEQAIEAGLRAVNPCDARERNMVYQATRAAIRAFERMAGLNSHDQEQHQAEGEPTAGCNHQQDQGVKSK